MSVITTTRPVNLLQLSVALGDVGVSIRGVAMSTDSKEVEADVDEALLLAAINGHDAVEIVPEPPIQDQLNTVKAENQGLQAVVDSQLTDILNLYDVLIANNLI